MYFLIFNLQQGWYRMIWSIEIILTKTLPAPQGVYWDSRVNIRNTSSVNKWSPSGHQVARILHPSGLGVQNPRPWEISRFWGDIFPNSSLLSAVYGYNMIYGTSAGTVPLWDGTVPSSTVSCWCVVWCGGVVWSYDGGVWWSGVWCSNELGRHPPTHTHYPCIDEDGRTTINTTNTKNKHLKHKQQILVFLC